MREPKLITCFDCGHALSRSALECPKCGTSWPQGINCAVCGRRSSVKSMVEQTSIHRECIKSLFTVPNWVRCSDCGASLSHLLGDPSPWRLYSPDCPNCGRRWVLGESTPCAQCGLLIYAVFQRSYWAPFASSVNLDGSIFYSTRLIHELCYAGQQVQDLKVQEGLLIERQHTLEFQQSMRKNTGCFSTLLVGILSIFSILLLLLISIWAASLK